MQPNLTHSKPAQCRPASRLRPLVSMFAISVVTVFTAVAALAALTAPSALAARPTRKAAAQATPTEALAIVDQMWGPISAMVGVADRLYVAQGARLLVVDGWHGASPTLIGRSPVLAGPSVDLAVDGDRAAVALWEGGVAVIDVADPRAPRVVTTISGRAVATHVALAGDRLWVAHDRDGLVVYDLGVDPPRVLQLLGGRVDDLAAENGRVAAIMAATPNGQPAVLEIWPDGAGSLSVVDDNVFRPLTAGHAVALVEGRIVVASAAGLAEYDEAAQPAWSVARRLDIACRPMEVVAGGGRVIVTCDIPHTLTHIVRIPPTGPLTIEASVSFPHWIESGWIDADGVAVGLVGGGLRTFGAVAPDGGLRGVAAVDLGPDIVTHSTQDGTLVGLSGNWGQAWQARVLGARADGVERTPLPTLVEARNPSDGQAIVAFGNRFVLAAHAGQDLEVGVASLVSGTWRLDPRRERVNSGSGIAVLPPLTPGTPALVVVTAFDRVRTAALNDGVVGPFDGRLPWAMEDHPFSISADGQRVWLGTTVAAIGFERRADGWHPLATLPMRIGASGIQTVRVRAVGDNVYTLHEGALIHWDIAASPQPRVVDTVLVDGDALGMGFADAARRRLWVGTDAGLAIYDTTGDELTLLQRLETPCPITNWLPAPDGVIAPAWECGAFVLRADGAAPTPAPWAPQPGADLPGVPLPTASASPVPPTAALPTATPSPEPTAEPTATARRWTIYLPWVSGGAWQR